MSLISKESFNLALQSIKKLFDKKIVDSVADWNQNDPNADNYIKNKPFNYTILEPAIIPETVISEYYYREDNESYVSKDIFWNKNEFEFIEGRDYLVLWDDKEYYFIGQFNHENWSYYWYIGNGALWTSNLSETQDYFCIVKEYEPEYGTYWHVCCKDNRTHVIKVYEIEVSKINDKYLPNLNYLNINNISYNGTKAANITTIGLAGTGEYSEVFNTHHSEYERKRASGDYSHAEGLSTWAEGRGSHAEGFGVEASGDYSHAEGYSTEASGDYSHAGGYCTQALAQNELAYGKYNIPAVIDLFKVDSGTTSKRRDGLVTYANNFTYDVNSNTITLTNPINGTYASAPTGCYYMGQDNKGSVLYKITKKTTSGSNWYNISFDAYRIAAEQKYAHVVGNGTSNTARSNAHTLDWEGNAWYQGDVYVGSTSGTNRDEGSERLARASEIDNSRPNWAESDLTNKGVILNKPFGTTWTTFALTGVGNEYGSIIFNITDTNVRDIIQVRDNFIIYKDNYYKITFANLGTGNYWTITGEGFSITGRGDTDWNLTIEGETFTQNQTYEFSVAALTENKLNEQHLPTTVPVIQTAEPGQTIVVKSVDENGHPTEWEAADLNKDNRVHFGFVEVDYNTETNESTYKIAIFNDINRTWEFVTYLDLIDRFKDFLPFKRPQITLSSLSYYSEAPGEEEFNLGDSYEVAYIQDADVYEEGGSQFELQGFHSSYPGAGNMRRIIIHCEEGSDGTLYPHAGIEEFVNGDWQDAVELNVQWS